METQSTIIILIVCIYCDDCVPACYNRLALASYTGSTELNASVLHEVALEHFEMNTNDAYGTNTAEIATTENIAYMTAGDVIPATQNVACGQVPPETDDYDYI